MVSRMQGDRFVQGEDGGEGGGSSLVTTLACVCVYVRGEIVFLVGAEKSFLVILWVFKKKNSALSSRA